MISSAIRAGSTDLLVHNKEDNARKVGKVDSKDRVHKEDSIEPDHKAGKVELINLALKQDHARKVAKAGLTDPVHKVVKAASTDQDQAARDVVDLTPPLLKKKRKQNQLRTISARNGTRAKLQTKSRRIKKITNAKKTARHWIVEAAGKENRQKKLYL